MVIRSETKLKAWGNSVGVILPKEQLEEENLTINDEVEVTVRKKTPLLKEVFGRLKGFKAKSGKSTEDLLHEIDEELKSRFD